MSIIYSSLEVFSFFSSVLPFLSFLNGIMKQNKAEIVVVKLASALQSYKQLVW
jgi:hypothetical protein